MTTTRRTILSLAGAAPLALAIGNPAGADKGHLTVPDGLRPGGKLDTFVAELAAKDEFSGSLLLTHRGRPVLSRSYGMANKALGIPNGPDTIFALASVTKVLTAVSVVQLVERGKLSFGAKLGTLLDGFAPAIGESVTVHHLLTHTSGLGDFHRAPGFWETARTWTSAQQVMDGITQIIRGMPVAFPAGSSHTYSNAGFHLLGAIVAKVSGLSYYDYVRQNVFQPAGMSRSDFYTKPQWLTDPRIAHPYTRPESGERIDDISNRYFVGTPAGEAFCSCSDLDRFAQALLRGKLMSPPFLRIYAGGKVPLPRTTPPPGAPPLPEPPPVTLQCYGPLGRVRGGQWTFGHGGGSPGISTSFEVYPDSRWTLVVFSNYDPPATLPIEEMARQLITGQR
ncbi:serine hydrolase domain-containing protein [Micromonospora sp. NPDC047670]|uniref:serine hydrolase domain-containing protein n=1 Tax=Micromonospora sp. NPDC047670 TaxID=3364252 RepID=UPI003713347A